ncbi:site-specific DNA-methyltransferase, partial [bacterium]|nr:site-specific DNA-methyltransferase [bacterium]
MKPYYQDEAVTIYHGDCRGILPELPKVDLVMTDPPYGMAYHSGHYIGYNPHKPIIGDEHYPIELLPIFEELASKAVFMFCRWDNLRDVPHPKSFIAVVKNNWSAGDLDTAFGRQWEGILFYPQKQFVFNRRLPDVIDCRRVPATELLNPAQKAEYPIQLLIQECSMPNDLILDPFLGSGTTAFCAKKLNRKCIGIE